MRFIKGDTSNECMLINYEDVVDASDDDCSGHEPVVGLATIFWLDKSWSIIGGHQPGWRSCTIMYG